MVVIQITLLHLLKKITHAKKCFCLVVLLATTLLINSPSLFVAGKDNRKLHSLDPRPCAECGKMYSNLSNLRQHMKLIHYPTFVSCQFCNKQFKTDLYLRRHIQSAHKDYEIYMEHSFNCKKLNENMTKFKKSIRDI